MKKILFLSLALSPLLLALFYLSFEKGFVQGECPFCEENILKRFSFYESPAVMGLVTHKPATQGHVLIIPKRHIERFEELTDDEMVEIKKAIEKIHLAEKRLFGKGDYMLLQKNGVAAGQSVPHVHFHYLPRSDEDNHLLFALKYLFSSLSKPLPSDELEHTANQLAETLSSLDRR